MKQICLEKNAIPHFEYSLRFKFNYFIMLVIVIES